MNVSLTPELEQMIQQKVETGRYQTASEVVREALRMFDHQEKSREARLTEWRTKIAIGIRQLEKEDTVSEEEFLEMLAKRKTRKTA